MGYFIDSQGNYREGDRESLADISVSQRPSSNHIWNGNNWTLDISVVLKEKYEEINTLRDNKINIGISYTFPDGNGTVQTRDEIDFRNIQGRVSAGMILAGQEILLDFRDQEDVTHYLSPEQMVTMGLYVSNKVSEIYKASWTHKDNLKLISENISKTNSEIITDIQDYDITTGWPV